MRNNTPVMKTQQRLKSERHNDRAKIQQVKKNQIKYNNIIKRYKCYNRKQKTT